MQKTPENNIRIGLIGAGTRIRGLIKHLIRRHPDAAVQFVAASDPDENSVAELENITGAKIRRHANHNELCAQKDNDWVFISSWNCFNREHAVAALAAGKNIFLEKPLATTLEDCLAIRAAQKKSGAQVFFGFCLRYAPHFRRVKQIVTSGDLGDILSFEFNETLYFSHGGYIAGNWRRLTKNAGPHILEKCSHDMDIANWLLGSRAGRVASFGGRNFFTPKYKYIQEEIGKSPEGELPYMEWPDPTRVNPFSGDGDIVDNQVAILEYANGVRAAFHTNLNASLNERRMYILGTRGTMRADAVSGRIEFMPIGYNGLRREEFTGEVQGHNLADKGLVDELVKAMLEGAFPKTGIREGPEAAVTCLAINDAMRTGNVVDLAPYWEKVDQSD